MSALEERPEDETGYGAAVTGDMDDAPEQDQPQTTREPGSDEEIEQDNYANTDDKDA